MNPTRFFLIRHAIVEPSARTVMYGDMDVAICAMALAQESAAYQWLATRLPEGARWFTTPLTRTRSTVEAIFAAGYAPVETEVEPRFVEQHLGEWQGITHEEFTARLTAPPHPFWPHAAEERPPGGEALADVIGRVGPALEDMVEQMPGQDVVVVAHGGSIRAALAYALRLDPHQAFQFSVKNLSLTRLEWHRGDWRVVSVNEEPPLSTP
ncbi:histidine phosphatase family protein [Pseudoroseomonas wenyumeiae]|uniref:phosphoglycerate mutase (2,3-diphosphoglycerate-dependent) n=1 Tax=Teichococcus wenyumeiae TaxID=2478470 RepID=A0A3A9JGW5_9PROT|nr:histidine phosphatase family protein [Pseudoroseomonas wenyumeiae]RKK04581.1 histidine phosphatase family protein [Pseudoroseomonas wenyumeiae]RMI20877.1 histidine phosphatase family protein [Pseudoroseomonas wenyumeiae]